MKNKPHSADILLLPSWYLPHGGEFCREQAWYLNRIGLKADILASVTLSWRKNAFQLLTHSWHDNVYTDDGIATYRKFHRPIPFLDETNTKRWTQATLALFERYMARMGKPRLIHAHSSTWAGYAAALIQEKHRIPYVITEHRGIFGWNSKLAESSFKPYYDPLLQKAFSDAATILAVSDQQLPKIKTYLQSPVPTEILSNIVDTDFFSCKNRKSTKKGFRFISVNSYRDVKGYDIMLPAFDEVCKEFPDTELVLVGEDFDHPEFREVYERCIHKQSIRFTGLLSREEVRSHLWESDSLVISSRVEAQSISVLEALSTGLPVVCTQPIPEYVVGPDQGLRVPIEDIPALAAAMCNMIHIAPNFDPEQLAKHVHSIASPSHIIQRLIQIYQSIAPEISL